MKREKLLTIKTVAEELACSERHIRNLIKDGHLVAIRVGTFALRVTEMSLVDFKTRRTVNVDDYFE